MPISPNTEKVLKGLDAHLVRWTPDAAQAAGLLHIADALQEKNKLETLRIKLDIIHDQTNFDRAFRQKLINDISNELY